MEKRGLSAIIATILIILIIVIAITIIWIAVLPLIKDKFAYTDTNVRLSVVTSESYTFYDPETGGNSIQIERGGDEERITEFHITYVINGTSTTLVFYDDSYIPEPNQIVIINMYTGERPELIRVMPVYPYEGEMKIGRSHETGMREAIPIEPIEQGDYTPARDLYGKTIVDEGGNVLALIS